MTTALQQAVETAAPRAYVFGGSLEHPELGANGRRLWRWCEEHLTRRDLAQLKREVLAAQSALETPERFVSWSRIVETATMLGLSGKDGTEINAALVRRLQAEDDGGKIGRDRSIRIAA